MSTSGGSFTKLPSDAERTPSGSDSSRHAPTSPSGFSFRRTANRSEALEALVAFVRACGVEEPATTEAELLLQAAPHMSESLDANLRNAWTPEERSRLDAQPIPERLDHTRRDHEYFFFRKMQSSLERRASRSSSFSTTRSSTDTRKSGHERQLGAEEEAQWRAQCRRHNLQAVWGEEGRAVLTALDSLPETEVLQDADCTPPASPTYGSGTDDQHDASAAREKKPHKSGWAVAMWSAVSRPFRSRRRSTSSGSGSKPS